MLNGPFGKAISILCARGACRRNKRNAGGLSCGSINNDTYAHVVFSSLINTRCPGRAFAIPMIKIQNIQLRMRLVEASAFLVAGASVELMQLSYTCNHFT